MIQSVKWHLRDDAFKLIVKSKDRCIHCGCHHAIYLLASHRNPKEEDRPAAWHTGKGAYCFARMSSGSANRITAAGVYHSVKFLS